MIRTIIIADSEAELDALPAEQIWRAKAVLVCKTSDIEQVYYVVKSDCWPRNEVFMSLGEAVEAVMP